MMAATRLVTSNNPLTKEIDFTSPPLLSDCIGVRNTTIENTYPTIALNNNITKIYLNLVYLYFNYNAH